MAETWFTYHGVEGFVDAVARPDNSWSWAFRVPGADLVGRSEEPLGSELAAHRDGLRAAHGAIDRSVGGQSGVFEGG